MIESNRIAFSDETINLLFTISDTLREGAAATYTTVEGYYSDVYGPNIQNEIYPTS